MCIYFLVQKEDTNMDAKNSPHFPSHSQSFPAKALAAGGIKCFCYFILLFLAFSREASACNGQCPYGGSATVNIYFNNTEYFWSRSDCGALITSSNGVPEFTAECDSAEVFWGAGTCISLNCDSYEIVANTAGCIVTNMNTNDIHSLTVMNPTNSGYVEIKAKVTYDCNDGSGPQTLEVSGTINVDLKGGCSSCNNNNNNTQPSFGSGEGVNGCLDYKLRFGATSMFKNNGFLWLQAEEPSSSLATPSSLRLPHSMENVEVVTNVAGVIQQVKVPMGLVNVVSNNPYQFQLQVFAQTNVTGSSAPYGSNGPAFVTWVVSNPDGSAGYNRLWITEQRSGVTDRQFQFAYTNSASQAHRWDLLEPDGTTLVSKWHVQNPTNSTIADYYEQTASGTNILRYICSTRQSVPFVNGAGGLLTLKTVEGFGAAVHSVTNVYYASTNTDGSANRLERKDSSDGSWEYYVYDSYGRVTTMYSTFGNNPPPALGVVPDPSTDFCKKTDYTYDDYSNTKFTPTSTTVSIPDTGGNMIQVSASYHSGDSSTYSQDYESTPQGNLTTLIYNYDHSDPASSGRVKSISHPDGTVSYYTYSLTSSNFTTVESVGVSDYWNSPAEVTNGTKTTTVIDTLGRIQLKEVRDIQSDSVISQLTYAYSANDPLGRDYVTADLANRTNQYHYACCGLESTLDPDGVSTLYTYDSMKRASSVAVGRGSSWVTTTNQYDGLGRVLKSARIGSDGSSVTLSQVQYDVLGRVVKQANALNGVTTTLYGTVSSQQVVTNLYPDGGTRIETYQRDGQLALVTGTAVHGKTYGYGVEYAYDIGAYCQFTVETNLDELGNATSEWIKTYTDPVERRVETLYPGDYYYDLNWNYYSGPNNRSYYNSLGQLWKQIDPDGVTTFYIYNDLGERAYTINATTYDTSVISDYDNLVTSYLATILSGTDRVTWTTNDVISDHGTTVRRSQTYVWLDGQSEGTLASVSETSADGLKSWRVAYGQAGQGKPVTNSTETAYGSNSRTTINTAPDGSYTISTYSYGRLVSSTRYDSSAAQIGGTTYSYDAHGRQYQVTDARNGSTTYSYNNADQVSTVTTPAPGGSGGPQTTTTLYDTMLRPYSVIQPDGTSVNSDYLLTGELGLQHGSRTYPVAYGYDYAGRMQTMTNWTSFSSLAGARVTTWTYDGQRGWLTNKMYADGKGPFYTYTPGGRLLQRDWVRGVTTAYAYNGAGSLTNIAYSDTTPSVTNTYDRLGRLSTVQWTNITGTMTYNLANELLTESFTGGVLNGLSVTNGYDRFLRRTNLTALASSLLGRTTYGYDAASRLATVSDGNNSATYSYFDNSPLVSQIRFTNGTALRMTTTKSYDYLNRLTQISSAPTAAGAVPATFNYTYNDANQRTKNVLADSSYWVYQYDSLGQVTNGVKYFYDGTLVPGQQFGYLFDDIGNRKQTQSGGDALGAGLRVASYSANNLNQITSRYISGTNDVIGVALATNSVLVNGQSAWRKGEYFWSTVASNNATAAQWEGIKVASGDTTNTGYVYAPKTPEVFQYDADGNLTNDGRWAYTWDAENRMTSMTVNTNVGPQYQLTFAYDAKSRRIQKTVSTNGVGIYTNKFLYDAWNLVAELQPDNTRLRTYVWGTDLSGSLQGAGGVGGLLEVSCYGAATTNCFSAFDGNGNVMALVNAADGMSLANYAYGPFGELIQQTGIMARNNSIRFSTKYQDDESDLLYYGHRYYKPSTGTWPSRDLIGEEGGINLYGFVYNAPVNTFDTLGDQHFKYHVTATTPTYSYTDYRGISHTEGGDSVGATIEFDLSYTCDNGRVNNVTYGGFQGNIDGLIGSWPGNEFTFGFGFFEIYERHSFLDTTVEKILPSPKCCEKKLFTVKVEWRTKAGVDFTPSIGPIAPFPTIPGPVLVDKKIANFSFPLILSCCP